MKARLLFSILLLAFTAAQGQLLKPTVLMYGESITLENAKKVAAAGEAHAIKNQWLVVIAIVDTGGNLVYMQRMDNAQIGSIDVAIGKAQTANNFKRPTRIFEEAVASGGVGLRVLSLPGAVPLEGGELIMSNGKIIGAIGVSGVQASQDAEIAKAGLSVIK